MFKDYNRIVLRGTLLILLMALQACAASPASKVQCDSNLRPINPQLHQP